MFISVAPRETAASQPRPPALRAIKQPEQCLGPEDDAEFAEQGRQSGYIQGYDEAGARSAANDMINTVAAVDRPEEDTLEIPPALEGDILDLRTYGEEAFGVYDVGFFS